MQDNTKKRYGPFLEGGIIQSLYYLYQELLKSDMQELTCIMEITIQDCEEAIRRSFSISQEEESIFRQFHILQEFRKLSKKQKESFLCEIGRIKIEH